MKKITNSKVYDTDTAIKIGAWNNGLWDQDLNIVCETLYRTESGNYFLHGEGGPRTLYSKYRGDELWSSGESIIPYSVEEARAWAEEHMDPNDIIKEFNLHFEGDLLVARDRVTVTLHKDIAARLREADFRLGEHQANRIIDEAVTEWLDARGAPGKSTD